MRIALCDWDKAFIEKIKNIIYTYAELFRIDIVVDCYNSGEQIINSDINYNIIFLGYKLCGINGFETAEKIRIKNSVTSIVFLSEYTDFVFDAFKVSPIRFLVKPVEQSAIYEVLDDYFKKYGTDYPLWIKCGEDVLCLNTREIYYLEADNKHCLIHLKNETLRCNHTMARVYELLPKCHFSKINRAFIVNLNFIEKYNNQQTILKNRTELRISRNYLKSFKEEFRTFFQPRELIK